jgi:uncharacterized protein
MIIVSDTSPLTNLAAIGRFDLLQKLFGKIHIPEVVLEELNYQGKIWPGFNETVQADWISRHKIENEALVTALLRDLDKGEAQTIALGIELNADLVLLDEREGRRQAKRFGLKVLGVVGILLAAKEKKFITLIQPELDALRQKAGFYVNEELVISILDLAGES